MLQFTVSVEATRIVDLLLELRHGRGMTFVQVGESLGISEQAARKRWNVLSRYSEMISLSND